MTSLRFELGSLVLEDAPEPFVKAAEGLLFDPRTKTWRAPAYRYREIVLKALEWKLNLHDEARQYQAIALALKEPIAPRQHQSLALEAWVKQQRRGVVSLPTGAGKTILAVLAIQSTGRPSLVVVPTIDLLIQWQQILSRYFERPIGALGGGQRDVQDLTVATYDSALIMIEGIGQKFGLLIFDECHHLPATQYQFIAKAAIAPFRLGLSATVERSDGREEVLFELVGDLCFEGQIKEMVSTVLAPYDVINLEVPLSDTELGAYKQARAVYTKFVKLHRIDFSSPGGWQDFIRKSSSLPGGREAMEGYREQKRLALGAEGKIRELWRILQIHRGERIIIFTHENGLAYQIGQNFLLPVLTHQTKPHERKKMLESFKSGVLDVLVTSKVLNEGVDVPEASIGIVISGSGAVREHVQRLGRILRHREGKRATLYEIISKDTSEYYVNKRRRMHHAYQRPSQVHQTRG